MLRELISYSWVESSIINKLAKPIYKSAIQFSVPLCIFESKVTYSLNTYAVLQLLDIFTILFEETLQNIMNVLKKINMETNTLAPVMHIIAFCGFSMPLFRKPKLQTSINVYCLVFTMLQFIVFIIFMCTQLHLTDYSITDGFKLCLLTLVSLVLVYNKIKFLVCLETHRNIIGNITCVDQSLESLWISVPRAKNKTEISLPFVVLFSLIILLLC